MSTSVKGSSTAIFCPECQSILGIPVHDGDVICDICEFTVPFKDVMPAGRKAITKSSLVAQNVEARKVQGTQEDLKSERALSSEICPKCNKQRMTYYTLQQRSVDEGATVYYDCLECGYKFSLDN